MLDGAVVDRSAKRCEPSSDRHRYESRRCRPAAVMIKMIALGRYGQGDEVAGFLSCQS